MAGSFRTPSIIADPSGRLTELRAAVSRDFAKRRWVYKRYEHAKNRGLRNLRSLDERFDPGYRKLLGDLGITSYAVLQQRKEQIEVFLPRVWEVAEAIMAPNPRIED
jgi:hypothetical protein